MSKIDVYNIEKDVPIPEQKGVPIEKLEVGESLTFDEAKRNSVQTKASTLKAKEYKEFTVRSIEGNQCRIWRTK